MVAALIILWIVGFFFAWVIATGEANSVGVGLAIAIIWPVFIGLVTLGLLFAAYEDQQ